MIREMRVTPPLFVLIFLSLFCNYVYGCKQMDQSSEQFNELLAHIMVRNNKMLSEHGYVIPFGLTLDESGKVEVIIAASEDQGMEDHANMIQKALQEKVIEKDNVVASCISYPDHENKQLVVLLENNENYCSKVTIPAIKTQDGEQLDYSQTQFEEGNIYVFPIQY